MPAILPDDSALKLLACPVCHGALRLLAAEASVICLNCGRRYPLHDGLPVLLASAAQQ